MLEFLLALLAGVVTVGGPCILPLLPIVLGTNLREQHRLRPLVIVLGFVLAFSSFALLFSVFGGVLGLSPTVWRYVASAVIAVFGLMLLVPRFQALLFARVEPLVGKLMPAGAVGGRGLWSGFLLGLSLGAVWTPCAGPVLGTILTLVAAKQNLLQAGVLLGAFALGAGVPMLLIAYGGQAAAARVRKAGPWTGRVQRGFGALIVLVALGMATQMDVRFQAWLLEKYPWLFLDRFISLQSKPTTLDENFSLPETLFRAGPWINSQPLVPADVRGRVVLVDFWTYSCVNCIRTQPVLRAWHKAYADKGLVMLGVHTPEFAFEKNEANVRRAVERAQLSFPVVMDNDYAVWRAFENRYWPATYLFDASGRLRYSHFGEGNYAETEMKLRELLQENGAVLGQETGADSAPDFTLTHTPETYFGYARAERFTGGALRRDALQAYALAPVEDGEWSLGGEWKVTAEYAGTQDIGARLRMRVDTDAMHLVLAPASSGTELLRVLIDGAPPTEEMMTKDMRRTPAGDVVVEVTGIRLYQVARIPGGGKHTVELEYLPNSESNKTTPGIFIYSATFGDFACAGQKYCSSPQALPSAF